MDPSSPSLSTSSSCSSFVVISGEESDQPSQITSPTNPTFTSHLQNQSTSQTHSPHNDLNHYDSDINEGDDENDDDDDSGDENLDESDSDELNIPTTTRPTDYDDISMGSAEETEDDLLSMGSSDDITIDPPISDHIPRVSPRRIRPKIKEPPVFTVTLPPNVIHSIFMYFDHGSLHTLLTVSKGWFLYATNHLYRDPFGTIGRARGRTDVNVLRPTKERLLVRLLLRSIRCPSEPGEEETLVDEEAMDSDSDLCTTIIKDGVEIKTTINYFRLLEVFEWAPLKRYLDFWSQQSAIIDENGEFFSCPPSIIFHEGAADPVFRFSYHTILDWFPENENARAIVLHPEIEVPEQIARQLSKWKTLYFDRTAPEYYYSPSENPSLKPIPNPYYRPIFNNLSLVNALLGHLDVYGKNGNGINDLQVPPEFYYFGEDYIQCLDTILNVMSKLKSLDASTFPGWGLFQLDLPDEIFEDLERFVFMSGQDNHLTNQQFIKKCRNLKEVEMVANWEDLRVTSPPMLKVLKVYVDQAQHLSNIYDIVVKYYSNLRVLKIDIAPPEYQSKSKHYTDTYSKYEYTICGMRFVMPHLEDLYLRLDDYTRIGSKNPFGSCPRLKRLTLVATKVVSTPVERFQVPLTITDLVLDGIWIQVGFDETCVAQLPHLHSLALLNSNYSMTNWGTSINYSWEPETLHSSLDTLRLSGFVAKRFRFKWLDLLPSLKTLEVDGLDYEYAIKSNAGIVEDREEDSMTELTQSRGPRFCKFTVINAEILQKSTEETVNYLVEKAKTWNLTDNASGVYNTASLETLFKCLSISRESIDPPTNNDILNVLRRYCPAIQHLRMDFEGDAYLFMHDTVQTKLMPIEIPLSTVSRLKSYLPNLSRFRTDSYTINNTKLAMFSIFGFIARGDTILMDSKVEDCVYKFAEAEYLKSVRH
ncbi:hypothetical protein BGZ76_004311 [Entomortierella beljakovae]|nr:hypothetical protein BGZ76_004311 [Entomortierella beljakovae]